MTDHSAPSTVGVSVTLTLEVNAAEWAAEYGIHESEVRQDVKNWALHTIDQSSDLIRSAELRR